MNNANKLRKTIEWERLEIFSSKLEIPRELGMDAKMGIMKDRNGKDLIVAEGIKKRWQGYAEGLLKKKKVSMTWITKMAWHSPRDRHSGVWNQVGLRKHYFEQS